MNTTATPPVPHEPGVRAVPAERPSRGLAERSAGRRTRPLVSFELFPPRSEAAREALSTTVAELASAGPDFVSVTYGASGSAHDASRELLAHLVTEVGVPTVAHITCVGRDEAALRETITDFAAVGVSGFLALRGDPPRNEPEWEPSPDSVASGAALVALVREVCADAPDGPGGRTGGRRPDVAVPAFPGGHPRSSGLAQDVEVLRAKQDAGADFALTQLFFDPASYTDLVGAARAAGVDLPVVPGIVPLTDPAALERLSRLTGVPLPGQLATTLAGCDGPARHRAGVAATARLVRAVLDAGAPGVHLYSMNRHEAVLDVLELLDLPDALPDPAPSPQRRG